MRDLTETGECRLDAASAACLNRTRSAVLNVLVGVGAVVALSGLVLRGRPTGALAGPQQALSHAMLLGLFILFVVSTLLRRLLGRQSRLRDPMLRDHRFFLAHILPAVLGALAAPLGLAYGWLISPRLEAILPFWLVALILGSLAYPRTGELEGFDQPMPSSAEPD
jgi:hypothetical protein